MRSGRKARFDDLIADFPELTERLGSTPRSSRDQGAGPLLQGVAAVQRGRLALVGDASGYLDAITGEGIAVALHQSAALVAALERGRLEDYPTAHRRIGRLPGVMTRAVLSLDRRPRLRRRTLAALAAEPALFSRLLGVHASSDRRPRAGETVDPASPSLGSPWHEWERGPGSSSSREKLRRVLSFGPDEPYSASNGF